MTPVRPGINAQTIIEIRKALADWFARHQRKLPWRETCDPYAIWVSEVMLQQTQVKTVIPYFLDFIAAHPTIRALAEADLETILKSWEGLGYYARARNLHKAAGIVTRDMGERVPDNYKAFLSLPGVGNYIAAAVQSIAFGRPFAVVDGNVKRVLARLFTIHTPINTPGAHKAFQDTSDRLLDREDPGTFNQALMELGALVCTPKSPRCGACPLSQNCRALAENRISDFPVRVKKEKVPTHPIAVGIVRNGEKVLITRRKLNGLLGGLWEFPGGKVEKGESPENACAREILEETGLCVRVDTRLTRIKHAYTHFKIEMDVFYCTYLGGEVCLEGPIDYAWVSPSELESYPFPKANLKFLPMIQHPEEERSLGKNDKKNP